MDEWIDGFVCSRVMDILIFKRFMILTTRRQILKRRVCKRYLLTLRLRKRHPFITQRHVV